jgi:hypothetical protein
MRLLADRRSQPFLFEPLSDATEPTSVRHL